MSSEETDNIGKVSFQVCTVCGISEPASELDDGVCEHCSSDVHKDRDSEDKINAVTDIKKSAKPKKSEPISFWYFWLAAGISIYLGIHILGEYDSLWGVALIITVPPILILYPIIRFLFGGKDSIGALLLTVIVSEIFKSKVKSKIIEYDKNR